MKHLLLRYNYIYFFYCLSTCYKFLQLRYYTFIKFLITVVIRKINNTINEAAKYTITSSY